MKNSMIQQPQRPNPSTVVSAYAQTTQAKSKKPSEKKPAQKSKGGNKLVTTTVSKKPAAGGKPKDDKSATKVEGQDELYCVCRKIDTSRPMLSCDKCEEWYHFDCVGLDMVSDDWLLD